MNFEIEMFFDPHLRVLIEAPTNLLSREVPEWKRPIGGLAYVCSDPLNRMDATACVHPKDTMSPEVQRMYHVLFTQGRAV